MKKAVLLIALLLLPAIALYGCSGGTSSVTGTSGDSGPAVSKTGSLTISAKFPQNGKKGEIGTALIDQNTQYIDIDVYDARGRHHYVELTPANPTATIANIPVGRIDIHISTYDSARSLLDYLNASGEIVEGQNTLVATLIRGSWQFVDAQGNPVSIRLNGTLSSATDTLDSFSVIPYSGSIPPTDYVTIQGCVYDDPTTMNPIPGAVVSTSLDSQTAVTDANGCFFLQTNTPATYSNTPYTITIIAPGYPTFSQTWVWGDHPVNQVFYLNTGGFGTAGLKKSSIDDTKPWGSSWYYLLWKGSGLPITYCGSDKTCQSGIEYFNQFIGPSTNNNAIASGEIQLTPDPNYPDTYGCDQYGYCESNRSAFFFGLPIGFNYGEGEGGPDTITDPNGTDMIPILNSYATTRVTASDTITGNIVEVLEKTRTETMTCYDVNGVTTPDDPSDSNVLIPCPWLAPAKKAKTNAIIKALSERLGKAQTGNCYQNLNWSSTYTWTEYWDLDNDYYRDDPVMVVETYSGSGDVCAHAFTAKGSQLPSTDLGLIIQKKAKK